MNRRKTATILLVFGLFMIGYGYFASLPDPIPSTEEIREFYYCDRDTDNILPTDRYCADPGSAPMAKRNFDNYLVYVGFLLVVSGAIVGISAKKK